MAAAKSGTQGSPLEGTGGHRDAAGGSLSPCATPMAPAPVPISGSGVDLVEHPLGEAVAPGAGGPGGRGDPAVHEKRWTCLGEL